MNPIQRTAFAAAMTLVLSTAQSPLLAQHTPGMHGHSAMPTEAAMAKSEYRLGDLIIRQPWTRATPKGAPVAGGYVTITNSGKNADRLTGGSFDLADGFEIHEMSITGGIMKMRHLSNGLEIAPGQTVALKPGGYHLMFMKLKGQVMAGKPVKGTLVFEKAGKIDIVFAAARMGAKTPHAH